MALSPHETWRQSRLNISSNIGRDKSFVDDLNKERGIVRMRVAFVPRSAEIQPLFWRFVTFIPHTNNKFIITLSRFLFIRKRDFLLEGL